MALRLRSLVSKAEEEVMEEFIQNRTRSGRGGGGGKGRCGEELFESIMTD